MVRAFNIGSGFLIVAILTRGLGPGGYGTYALAQALSSVLSLAMHWGMYTFLTREIAASLAKSEFATAQRLEKFSRVVVLASMPVAASIFISISMALKFLGLFDISTAAIACIICMAAFNSCQQRTSAILSGRGRQLNAQVPEGLIRPALFISFLVTLGWAWNGNSMGALYIYATASAVALAAAAYLTCNSRPDGQPVASGPVPYRKWTLQLPPFALIGMIGIAMANADVLVLFSVLPRTELGQYKLAAVIASIPGNLHSIVISMLMPRAAAAWARGEKAELKSLACLSSRISFAFASFYSVILLIFGNYLIPYIFGSPYDQTYYLSCLLLVPALATTFVGSSFTILNMCGQVRLNSAIALAGLALSLPGLWLFGALWGAEGAAVAAGIATTAMNFAAWVAVKRRVGIRCDAFG